MPCDRSYSYPGGTNDCSATTKSNPPALNVPNIKFRKLRSILESSFGFLVKTPQPSNRKLLENGCPGKGGKFTRFPGDKKTTRAESTEVSIGNCSERENQEENIGKISNSDKTGGSLWWMTSKIKRITKQSPQLKTPQGTRERSPTEKTILFAGQLQGAFIHRSPTRVY